MKTYELARALDHLAKLLKSMPNQELESMSLSQESLLYKKNKRPEAAVGLHTLLNLSKIDKNQWMMLIEEHSFPITVRARDASRDIIGKVLAYLEKNPEAQKALKKTAEEATGESSKELTKALAILIGDRN